MVLGKEHIPKAQLASLDLELFKHSGCCLPSLLSLAELCLVDGVRGDTLFLDEFFDLGVVSRVSNGERSARGGVSELMDISYQIKSLLRPVTDEGQCNGWDSG